MNDYKAQQLEIFDRVMAVLPLFDVPGTRPLNFSADVLRQESGRTAYVRRCGDRCQLHYNGGEIMVSRFDFAQPVAVPTDTVPECNIGTIAGRVSIAMQGRSWLQAGFELDDEASDELEALAKERGRPPGVHVYNRAQ